MNTLLAQTRAILIASHAKIVLDLFHGLTAIGMRHKHARVGCVRAPALATGDVPGIADHELEVVVVINRAANIGIVVLPFLFCHHSILRPADVKAVKELAEYLVFGHTTSDYLRVLRCVVTTNNILCVKNARSILVDLGECQPHEIKPAWIHRTTHTTDEFFVVYRPAAIFVEKCEQLLERVGVETERTLIHCLRELGAVKRLGAIIVHDTELAPQSDDTACTSLLQFTSEALQHILHTTARTCRAATTRGARSGHLSK